MNNKELNISSEADLRKQMDEFYLKSGIKPRAIITTKENVEIIREWLELAPGCASVEFYGVPILAPEQLMFI